METSLYFNAMISSSAEGQVLVVHRAHFGRQDKTTCSLGRSACQIKKVDCTTPASINLVTDRYRCWLSFFGFIFSLRCAVCQTYDDLLFICIHRCSGKNNCSLSATSSVFGDPCIGTYKYLEVDYTCQCKYHKLLCKYCHNLAAAVI